LGKKSRDAGFTFNAEPLSTSTLARLYPFHFTGMWRIERPDLVLLGEFFHQ